MAQLKQQRQISREGERDERLIRYLLHELTPEEENEVEEEYFSDATLHERLLVVEDELIDSYVGGDLSLDRKELFEEWFLASPERREKVEITRSLTSHLESTVDAPRHANGRSVHIFSSTMLAGVAAVLFAGTFVLLRPFGMLHDIEQAMWYINMAAAIVLFARLCAQGLVRAYPFLFAYLFADTLEQIVMLAFAQDRHIYAEIYFVGQTAKVALAIFVVLEIYKLALAQQPALARFGRRMLAYLFLIAVAFALVNLLLEFDRGDPERRALLVGFLRMERSLDLVTFVVLILIAGFLLWFPVRVHRNVAIWLGGFLLYSFSRWAGLLLNNRFGQRTHELNVAELAVSLVCVVGWSLLLKRTGEKETVVTGLVWDSAEAERLSVQLDAINSGLVRMARY